MNYEVFSRNLTNEEKQQLLKYLPVVDTAKLPDRLESVTCVLSLIRFYCQCFLVTEFYCYLSSNTHSMLFFKP